MHWAAALSSEIRDAPIAIFLADSDFFVSVICRYRFLPIPIFFLKTIIDSIYKQISILFNEKICIYIIKKILNITPIWTKLQMFCHLNNFQNKVLCD